jgi:hypothetical protein
METRIDALARSLATRLPRRWAVRSLAGGALTGTGLLAATRPVLARQPRTGIASPCSSDEECDSEFAGAICRGERLDRYCLCPNGATLCTDPATDRDFQSCINLETDARHCGACNRRCSPNQSCREGRCLCPGGKQPCGDSGPCCRANQRCINNTRCETS